MIFFKSPVQIDLMSMSFDMSIQNEWTILLLIALPCLVEEANIVDGLNNAATRSVYLSEQANTLSSSSKFCFRQTFRVLPLVN